MEKGKWWKKKKRDHHTCFFLAESKEKKKGTRAFGDENKLCSLIILSRIERRKKGVKQSVILGQY